MENEKRPCEKDGPPLVCKVGERDQGSMGWAAKCEMGNTNTAVTRLGSTREPSVYNLKRERIEVGDLWKNRMKQKRITLKILL